MSDICRETGLSRGGLYRYYSSTSELFEDIVGELSLNLEKNFNEAVKANVPAKKLLDIALDSYTKHLPARDTTLTAAMYEYCMVSGSKRVEESYVESKLVWKKLIEYGISTGEFNHVDPADYADAVILVFEGARIASRVISINSDTFTGITDVIKTTLLKKELPENGQKTV